MAVAMHEPAPPLQLNAELPPELSDLVMQLLEKDPAQRPASADGWSRRCKAWRRKLARDSRRPRSGTVAPGNISSQGTDARRNILPPGCLCSSAAIGGAVCRAHRPGERGLLRIQTATTVHYVIDTDDPDFSFQVSKGAVTLRDRKTSRKYKLRVLKFKTRMNRSWKCRHRRRPPPFKTKTFTIRRGQQVPLKDWFERQPAAAAANTDWVSLFNGKDLTGWEGLKDYWTVQEELE